MLMLTWQFKLTKSLGYFSMKQSNSDKSGINMLSQPSKQFKWQTISKERRRWNNTKRWARITSGRFKTEKINSTKQNILWYKKLSNFQIKLMLTVQLAMKTRTEQYQSMVSGLQVRIFQVIWKSQQSLTYQISKMRRNLQVQSLFL